MEIDLDTETARLQTQGKPHHQRHHVQHCSAINCNQNRFDNPDKSFFRFPLDEERCRRWVVNCRRKDLENKTAKQLFNGNVLCSDHFEDSQFTSKKKNRLKPKKAVPSLFDVPNPPKHLTPSRPAPKARETITTPTTVKKKKPLPCTSKTLKINVDEVTLLKRKIGAQSKRIKRLRASSNKPLTAKKEVERIKDLSSKYLNKESHVFFCKQIDLSVSKSKRWTQKDKAYALSLYHSSPKAYRLLQKQFFLPSVDTLRRLMRNIEVYPGFPEKIIAAFQTKVSTMSDSERLCALIFDEMALKQNLSYNIERDYVEGLEDLGGVGEENEERKPATHALVFMARGLVTKWKQPFGYVTTHSTIKAEHLKSLTLNALSKLKSIGLAVKAIVCDQGPNNLCMINSLGVTTDDPFFYHNGEKVLVFFDPPHLLKNIRNNLLKHKFFTADGEISWKVVDDFYERDKLNPLRMAPKLTNKHIKLQPFGKLRVRLATQVLSHSVACGIGFLCNFNVFPMSCMATAKFVSTFNNLFDTFNACGGKPSAPFRHAISPTSSHIKFLQDTLLWLEALQYGTGDSKKQAKTLPCIRGWIGNINALLTFVNDVTGKDDGIKYFLTNRLNQDCIENLFSVIRGKNGHMVNPDPQQFRNALRQVMVDKVLLTSEGSNCSDDLDSFLINLAAKDTTNQPLTLTHIPNEPTQLVNIVKSSQFDHLVQLENIVAYISGFIVRKLGKLVCDNCLAALEEQVSYSQRHLVLIEQKQYRNCLKGGLKRPSAQLVAFVGVLEMLFQTYFNRLIGRKKLRQTLKQKMLEHLVASATTLNRSLESVCCEVDNHVTTVFLTVRIHHQLKLQNEEAAEAAKQKNQRKLKTVNHQ